MKIGVGSKSYRMKSVVYRKILKDADRRKRRERGEMLSVKVTCTFHTTSCIDGRKQVRTVNMMGSTAAK